MNNDVHKNCFKCGERKPLSEYYKHIAMRDKHLNKCKTCTKSDVKERADRLTETDPEWAFNEKERVRLKSKNKSKNKSKAPKKWVDMDIKKRAASSSQHINCPIGYQRHHWSYREEHWKDVFIFTRGDHYKIHRYTIYDGERLQYRTIHGVLLDTKSATEIYYNKVLSIKDGIYSELEKLK